MSNPKATRLLLNVLTVLLVFISSSSSLYGKRKVQESTRDLGDQNATSKFLTLGEVDSWVIEAKDNEVIIVGVSTNQFDAIAGLAKVNGEGDNEEDEVLFSIDKDGSNSNFRFRIEKAGKYKIRVHGYEMKGGGNYQLSVLRFVSRPLELDSSTEAKTDDTGFANFFIDLTPGQFVSFAGSYSDIVYDPDGEIVPADWGSVVLIKKKGEHLIRARESSNSEFKFELRAAVVESLSSGDSKEFKSKVGTLHNWEIDAEKGQFQVITVSRKKNPASRIILAPSKDPSAKRLDEEKDTTPEIQYLPIASKGEFTTYAVVFGRTQKYLFQTYANRDSQIEITMNDPTIELDGDQKSKNRLNVGGAAYYGFKASAGDLVKMNLESETFDCVLRLFDQSGTLSVENDDYGDSKNSEISFLAPRNGFYRWQVASLGNGGGGDFAINFLEIPKKTITVGEVTSSKLEQGKTEYWSLDGEAGKIVYINIRAGSFTPNVLVYDANGRQLSSNRQGVNGDSLIPIELLPSGPLTIWVNSNGNGGGDYDIRVVDADWNEKDD